MGVVVGRSGESWRVDIGSAHAALLDGLAFEGATKRNRPNLKVRWFIHISIPSTEFVDRSVRYSTLASPWHIKTWNLNSNVLRRKRARLLSLGNSRGVS